MPGCTAKCECYIFGVATFAASACGAWFSGCLGAGWNFLFLPRDRNVSGCAPCLGTCFKPSVLADAGGGGGGGSGRAAAFALAGGGGGGSAAPFALAAGGGGGGGGDGGPAAFALAVLVGAVQPLSPWQAPAFESCISM